MQVGLTNPVVMLRFSILSGAEKFALRNEREAFIAHVFSYFVKRSPFCCLESIRHYYYAELAYEAMAKFRDSKEYRYLKKALFFYDENEVRALLRTKGVRA